MTALILLCLTASAALAVLAATMHLVAQLCGPAPCEHAGETVGMLDRVA